MDPTNTGVLTLIHKICLLGNDFQMLCLDKFQHTSQYEFMTS